MLAASALITRTSLHLRDQLIHDTITHRSARSPYSILNQLDVMLDYTITVWNVEVGKTVLGLTWAGFALLSVELGIWVFLFLTNGKRAKY